MVLIYRDGVYWRGSLMRINALQSPQLRAWKCLRRAAYTRSNFLYAACDMYFWRILPPAFFQWQSHWGGGIFFTGREMWVKREGYGGRGDKLDPKGTVAWDGFLPSHQSMINIRISNFFDLVQIDQKLGSFSYFFLIRWMIFLGEVSLKLKFVMCSF